MLFKVKFILSLQIEPYDVGISPELQQQIGKLLNELQIQAVPEVKGCVATFPWP